MLTAWDTSDHTDFSESTEAIAPLTEEEKKARLEELRQKLKDKKANQAITDKEDAKRNEVRTALSPSTHSHLYGTQRNTHMCHVQKIRQKATRDTQDAKEELQRKEQLKQAAKKRQEKHEEAEAKKRVRAQIEADKAERRRKAEEEKAAREGRAAGTSAPAPPAPAAAPKKTVDHTEARLKLQTSDGPLMKTLPAETTLFELAQVVEQEKGVAVTSFSMTFPRKTFEGAVDFGKTLKEAGLVPSAVLNVK